MQYQTFRGCMKNTLVENNVELPLGKMLEDIEKILEDKRREKRHLTDEEQKMLRFLELAANVLKLTDAPIQKLICCHLEDVCADCTVSCVRANPYRSQ